MDRIDKILIATFFVAALAVLGVIVWGQTAQATGLTAPLCGVEKTFGDLDSDVTLGTWVGSVAFLADFENNSDSGSPNTVKITEQAGFDVEKVWIDQDGSSAVEVYPANGGYGLMTLGSTFNPDLPGNDTQGSNGEIDEVIVQVQADPCPPPPVDLCSNIEGNQETIPEGYEDPNEDEICTQIPEVPVDVCDNLDGNQSEVPEGYSESEGICTEDSNETPTDVCPNIEGDQSVVPDGHSLQDGQCVEDSNGGGSSNNDNDDDNDGGGISYGGQICTEEYGKHYVLVPNPDSKTGGMRSVCRDIEISSTGGGSVDNPPIVVPLNNLPYTGLPFAQGVLALIGALSTATVAVAGGALLLSRKS